MHLIAALLTGIPGAANGHAELYRRGTSTRATWYSDFEGHGADSSGANITLGTYGEKNVYVAELVRVVVKSAAGVTLRDWVDGVSANCVEVRAGSFTGVDYDTAKSAAGNPTNLDAVLELWDDSAGGTDWEVGSGGTQLEDAVLAVSGVLYNVKAYGAVGDGVSNDAAAIIAANNAASAAGGGTLYFPPGTYLTTASLVLSANVALLGAGASLSILRIGNAASVIQAPRVESMTIDQAQNQTNYVLAPVGTAKLVTRDCVIGSSSFSSTQAVVTGFGELELIDTQIRLGGATQSAITCNSTATTMRGGAIVTPATYNGTAVTNAGGARFIGVSFDSRATNSGTFSFISYDTSAYAAPCLVVSGCLFPGNHTASACTCINLTGGTRAQLVERGNTFSTSGTPQITFYALDVAAATSLLDLGMREGGQTAVSTSGATGLTIDTLQSSEIVVEMTDNSAKTVTFGKAYQGHRLTVVWWNNHGAGGGTITFDTARVKMEAASNQFTVGANSFRVFEFRGAVINSTNYWVQVGEDTVDETE